MSHCPDIIIYLFKSCYVLISRDDLFYWGGAYYILGQTGQRDIRMGSCILEFHRPRTALPQFLLKFHPNLHNITYYRRQAHALERTIWTQQNGRASLCRERCISTSKRRQSARAARSVVSSAMSMSNSKENLCRISKT